MLTGPWVIHEKCHFGSRFASFTQFLGTDIFFQKKKIIKMASWLFCNNDHLTSCKKLKESDGQLLRKIHFRRVDRQMDKPCFIGLLSVKLGVQEVFVKLNQPHFF